MRSIPNQTFRLPLGRMAGHNADIFDLVAWVYVRFGIVTIYGMAYRCPVFYTVIRKPAPRPRRPARYRVLLASSFSRFYCERRTTSVSCTCSPFLWLHPQSEVGRIVQQLEAYKYLPLRS